MGLRAYVLENLLMPEMLISERTTMELHDFNFAYKNGPQTVSYTHLRAVVVALNDYFSREYRNEEDPYLETREKEDAFLERVETAVRDGVKESVPMAIAKNLMEMLVPLSLIHISAH